MIDPLTGDIFRKGQLLNNTYEIEGVLGRGGTGEVYRARNQITGRVVAVKALNRAFSSNDAYLELLKREEEMRNILHDAVVRYTDCSRDDQGHVYLVMDYVDGTPLSEWMERGDRVAPRDLLVIAGRVAEGLVATHARKIVHRDLSPDNIVLRGGEPDQAVIIDFGIAKDTNAGARTIVGNDFAGKYEYAAPEQLHGRAEPRSDLYALGASLLATFRGRVPDVGRSPGAVMEMKAKPLDTTGVPEPLRGLIDDLTRPDPAQRPASAQAVVDAAGNMLRAAEGKKARGKRRLWPLLLPLALVLLGVVGWFVVPRFFAEPLPLADPYMMVVEHGADGTVVAGHAPDAETREALLDSVAAATGERPAEGVELADGAPEDWAATIADLLAAARGLEAWRLEVRGRDASLTGRAPDEGTRALAAETFRSAAAAAGMAGSAAIEAPGVAATVEAVEAALAPLADCGPLVPAASPGEVYPEGGAVAVTGNVARRETIGAIRDALAPLIGDRTLRADVAILNPALCRVLSVLPDVPAGPISIALGYGNQPDPNLSGIYAVGDNPVIDVLVPASASEGHLWVAIADVTGNLFNILPNRLRPEHALSELGEVADGVRRIRVAYSHAERGANPSRLAFTVDDTFGKSVVIVFQTDPVLFGQLRPTTESVDGFAQELERVVASGSVRFLAIATQFTDSR